MKLNGKFYHALEIISNFFLLNLIWLMMCLPIITIFPATTAMFGVVRQWINGNDSGVIKPFFHFFKENFKQCIILGLIWTIAIFLLTIDFTFVNQPGSPIKLILLPVFILLLLALAFTTLFIFPVIVQYQANWKNMIKNSFLLSISHLSITFSLIFVTGMIGMIVWVFPFSALLIFSFGAYIIFHFCNRAFRRVEQTNGLFGSDQSS